MNSDPRSLIFEPPAPRHVLTLARGERVWRMTLRPAVLGAAISALFLLVVASAGATILFVLSDDVASAFKAREARTVSTYEKRIADLRRELDRAVSREHSDRRTVALDLDRMLDRQRAIEFRFDQMEPLLQQARSSGLIPSAVPVPTDRPEGEATADEAPEGVNAYRAPDAQTGASLFPGFDLRPAADRPTARGPQQRENERPAADEADDSASLPLEETGAQAIAAIGEQVKEIEASQVEQLARLAEAAEIRSAEIANVLSDMGVGEQDPALAMGGPYVPVPFVDPFTNEVSRLADALSQLRQVQEVATGLPLRAPVDGSLASSNFGVRLDPFFRRPAMHAGIDYPAATGTPVVASASGTVARAGRRGGYGLMIEIDHGRGHVTRYAHLSAIEVKTGQTVSVGEQIGRVGSTGRSTGPHLHYEVRRADKAIDPTQYLKAGEYLSALR